MRPVKIPAPPRRVMCLFSAFGMFHLNPTRGESRICVAGLLFVATPYFVAIALLLKALFSRGVLKMVGISARRPYVSCSELIHTSSCAKSPNCAVLMRVEALPIGIVCWNIDGLPAIKSAIVLYVYAPIELDTKSTRAAKNSLCVPIVMLCAPL